MKLALVLLVCVTAKVSVLSPPSLKTELLNRHPGLGEIRSSLANFGNPPYGTSIVGRVFYPKVNSTVCQPLSMSFSNDPDTVSVPILMVDRGDCTFAVKTRHAENAGAKAVLVLDNKEEVVESVVMADSGLGGNLQIPAFLVDWNDGKVVKRYLDNPDEVVVRLQFEVRKNDFVTMVLWFSAKDVRSVNFLGEFALYGDKFAKKELTFTPHYALWNCPDCKESGYHKDDPDCISGGRYCAPDPDGLGQLTGRDVLMEDLRQLCVYGLTSEKDTYSLWFDYMKGFNSTCLSSLSESCSKRVMDDLGINSKAVLKCVNNSFEGNNTVLDENSLMKKEKVAWEINESGFYPALLINTLTYRGDMEGLQVAKTICASYFESPEVCLDLEKIHPEELSGVSTSLVVVVVIVSIVVIAALLIAYRIYLKQQLSLEVKQQVNLAVSQYRALSSGSELTERSSG